MAGSSIIAAMLFTDNRHVPRAASPWRGATARARGIPHWKNQSWQPNVASGLPWSNGRQVGWWNPGLSAHAPYNNQLLPGSSVTQQRAWLLERRAAAASEIEQLRARHDSRGAARLATVMQGLNQRLNKLGG